MINSEDIKAGMTLGHADAVLIRDALFKLPELQKEEPAEYQYRHSGYGYATPGEWKSISESEYEEMVARSNGDNEYDFRKLFTCPVPAINLAELVLGDVPSCRECGCKSLTWHAAVQKNTAVQDGRLKLNELSGLFYLGCDECSETLAHVSDEEMAEFINSCRTATLRNIEEQSQ